MNTIFKSSLLFVFSWMAASLVSCSTGDPVPSSQDFESKIIGKWKKVKENSGDVITDLRMICTYEPGGKSYYSFSSMNNKTGIWECQIEGSYTLDGNCLCDRSGKMDCIGSILSMEEGAMSIRVEKQISNSPDHESSLNSVLEFVKVTEDYSKDIIGLWEGFEVTGGETDEYATHRIEYKRDGTYSYFSFVDGKWLKVEDEFNEYNVDGDWLASRWKQKGSDTVNYECWDIDYIRDGEMKMSALREKEDGSRFTTSITWKRIKNQIKVLGIGNSWTRDSFRYICGIAKSAGVNSVIAHAYLGGSGLADQFYGIEDPNYSYNHNGPQIVHSTYQYWLYDGTEDAEKTPLDSDYGNGSKGTGVTLESILKDKDWDIIIFQPSPTFVSKMDQYLGKDCSDPSTFSMARFVGRVKGLLTPEAAAKVKVGLMVPWSYPTGNTSRSVFVYSWNGGSEPSDQFGWDLAFDSLHAGIQSNAEVLSQAMGEPCEFFVNVGKAIYFARQNETLLSSGYKLQREQDNTHLAEGVAKYLASLMFVYEIFGIRQEQISFCPSGFDFNQAKVAAAREVAWAAWTGDKTVEVASVSTSKPEKLNNTSVILKGSFYGLYPDSAKDFSCGFEYREGEGEWQEVTVSEPFYEFRFNLSGLDPEKSYSVRAWASCAAGKKYGPEQIINLGLTTTLVLSPSVKDFQNQGIPAPKEYPVTGEDPGQEAFADKEFVYTHPETGQKYSFFFYGKGPQMYSSNKYYLYYAYSGGDFLFGKAGSYIKLPAVPGMRLESVTVTGYDSKAWGIAATLEQIAAREGIPGGEKHSFDGNPFTFKLNDTATNTSYYIFSANGTSKINIGSIVYSDSL